MDKGLIKIRRLMYRIAETGHTVSITKEKFLNTYPPLFSPLPVGFVQQAGDFFAAAALQQEGARYLENIGAGRFSGVLIFC